MRKTWEKASNGEKDFETGFRLDGTSDSFTIVDGAFTNEYKKLKMEIIPGKTFAVFHTHPNSSSGDPSTPDKAPDGKGDTYWADYYKLDMFVMSSKGLSYYDHTLKKTFTLQSNLDWQKDCPK